MHSCSGAQRAETALQVCSICKDESGKRASASPMLIVREIAKGVLASFHMVGGVAQEFDCIACAVVLLVLFVVVFVRLMFSFGCWLYCGRQC